MKMLLLSLLALILAFACSSLVGCGQEDSAAEDEDEEVEDEDEEVEETTTTTTQETNPCADAKLQLPGFENMDCLDDDGIVVVSEQSGSNVTEGYKGDLPTNATPILTSYTDAGLCPVNVHWHLGAEHLSAGEFDEDGNGPNSTAEEDKDGMDDSRRLAKNARLGLRCHYYDEADSKFTSEYNWTYCEGMHVGETYEVHWPHSAMGQCDTKWQYQTPFYDGVLCDLSKLVSTQGSIGVEGQVFTIVNDENNIYDDLFDGAWKDATHWADVAYYTGSTTGTSRDNTVCSKYSPITWQVDRKCHLVSASSFDKMCKKMKEQSDDMHSDLHAHGARELVLDKLAANNHQRL